MGEILPFPGPRPFATKRFPTPPHYIAEMVWDSLVHCRHCGAIFMWGKSDGGTWIPLVRDPFDPDTLVPHLPRCPKLHPQEIRVVEK